MKKEDGERGALMSFSRASHPGPSETRAQVTRPLVVAQSEEEGPETYDAAEQHAGNTPPWRTRARLKLEKENE